MERSYRQGMCPRDLVVFRVVVGETDLWVAAQANLYKFTEERVKFYRRQLRAYMERDAGFAVALTPRPALSDAPPLVLSMLEAGRLAVVGPMAAVAGAIAQAVGRDLAEYSPEIILENGGDIYLRSRVQRIIALHAGQSEFSDRIGIVLPPSPEGIGICTSSGTIGPSLSFGRADAATIVADDAALADAAASALGNLVQQPRDLEKAVRTCGEIPGVRGALAVLGSHLAISGGITLTPLSETFD